MRTPLQAMIWELWRTSRFELLIRIGGICAFALLLYSLSVVESLSEPETHVVNGIFVMLSTVVSLSSSAWWLELDRHQTGFSFRLGFTRPVSTTRLVTVPMIFNVAAAVICFVLPASLFSLLQDVPMPVVGPMPVIACGVVCLTAAAWSPTTIFAKVVGLAGLAIGMLASLLVFHTQSGNPDPILMAIGRTEYFDFGWQQYTAFLVTMAVAFVVTVVAVERQRHGDRWQFTGMNRWWRRTTDSPRKAQRPFTSRFAAQCWYETRRFGFTVLLLGVISPLVVFVFLSIGSRINPSSEGSPFVWLGALGLCPFVYQLVGADGALGLRRKQGALTFSAFDATRSMPNDGLIASKLIVIAACSLIGWLWMGLASGLHAFIAGDWHVWMRIGESVSRVVGEVPVYWWVAGISNAVLLYISSSSILLAFGLWFPLHPKVLLGMAIALYIHMIFAAWDAQHGWAFRYLWAAYSYLISIAIVAGCVLALRRALSAGFLGKRLFGCAFCLWVIYVSSMVILFIKSSPATAIPPSALVLGGSMLLVPLATTAIAPFALASHRHA